MDSRADELETWLTPEDPVYAQSKCCYFDAASEIIHAVEAERDDYKTTLNSQGLQLQAALGQVKELEAEVNAQEHDVAVITKPYRHRIEELEAGLSSAKRDAAEWYGKWGENEASRINLQAQVKELKANATPESAREHIEKVERAVRMLADAVIRAGSTLENDLFVTRVHNTQDILDEVNAIAQDWRSTP